MEIIDRMRMLLREKAILLGQYEQETMRLDTDDPEAVDEIVAAVEARQAVIDKIDGLDEQMEGLRDGSAYGKRCYNIGKNRCDYSSLNEGQREYRSWKPGCRGRWRRFRHSFRKR